MNVIDLARPEIRTLKPYQAAQQEPGTVRLNANESPRANSIGSFRRPLNRYPEVRPAQLQANLAKRFACLPQQLLVTRGSSEAIDLLMRCFCRAGIDNIVTTMPSFAMYRHYAEVQGAAVVEVATIACNDFAIEVDALLAAADNNSKIVFVCSPNNPTGTPLLREDLLQLLLGRNNKSIVVVDEAYIEFGSQTSAVELLENYPNLVILRTLSKALGFAGARCGAVIGTPDLISMLSAIQAPYALATPVVELVEDALQEQQLAASASQVAEVVAERERMASALAGFEFVRKVWPSEANFLLIDSGVALDVTDYCQRHGILLRHFGGALQDCIRITVGNPNENDALLSALEAFAENKR